MSKIFFVTISMRGGGTERVISLLANRMVAMGYEVTIMLIADSMVEYKLNERIRVICVSGATGGSLVGRIKRIWNMRREFSKNKEAKIISMGTVSSMFTLIAAIGLRNPITVSERNDPNRLNYRPIKRHEACIRNILYRMADKVVLQTPDVVEIFPEAIRKKSIVIGNPLPNGLPEPLAIDNREKIVISSGRFDPSKNYKMLIDAFAEFSRQHPEYKLKMFGKGETELESRRQIEELGMQDKILLCGFSDNIYEELGKAEIYVLSSNSEGLSNSLLEALAMGVPAIATDCSSGGNRMCIQDGVNGFIIPVGDGETLLHKMAELAGDIELRKKFSENAVRIREDYSESVITEQWLSCFD